MVGEPKDFWRMTLRPLGPSVTLTARASLAMPRRMASRASESNAICLAAIVSPDFSSSSLVVDRQWRVRARPLFEHGEDVFLVHQQDVVALAALEFVAGPVGEQ